MRRKICIYCKREFRPSRYHPTQRACAESGCQRRRRTDYHRRKLAEDAAYREQCRDSQKKWLARNPEYMRDYRRKQRRSQHKAKASLARDLHRLTLLAKNNVAYDLQTLDAGVWLLCSDASGLAKNILASAKLIVVKADASPAF